MLYIYLSTCVLLFQILRGSPGVKPSEVAIDFIHTSHEHFAAGIFWINCRRPELIDASLKSIEKV